MESSFSRRSNLHEGPQSRKRGNFRSFRGGRQTLAEILNPDHSVTKETNNTGTVTSVQSLPSKEPKLKYLLSHPSDAPSKLSPSARDGLSDRAKVTGLEDDVKAETRSKCQVRQTQGANESERDLGFSSEYISRIQNEDEKGIQTIARLRSEPQQEANQKLEIHASEVEIKRKCETVDNSANNGTQTTTWHPNSALKSENVASSQGDETKKRNQSKIPPRSKLQFKVGPAFGGTTQLMVLNDGEAKFIPQISARIDRGFNKIDDAWIGYKRNYITVVAAMRFYHGENYSIPEKVLYVLDGKRNVRVNYFAIRLTSTGCDDEEVVDLVQHTPKRDKGPQIKPPVIPIVPGRIPDHHEIRDASNVRNSQKAEAVEGMIYVNTSELQESQKHVLEKYPPGRVAKVARYERVQFCASVNCRRVGMRERFFTLVVELLAFTGDGKHYIISRSKTEPLIVRGRSPANYRNITNSSQSSTKESNPKRRKTGPSSVAKPGEDYNVHLESPTVTEYQCYAKGYLNTFDPNILTEYDGDSNKLDYANHDGLSGNCDQQDKLNGVTRIDEFYRTANMEERNSDIETESQVSVVTSCSDLISKMFGTGRHKSKILSGQGHQETSTSNYGLPKAMKVKSSKINKFSKSNNSENYRGHSDRTPLATIDNQNIDTRLTGIGRSKYNNGLYTPAKYYNLNTSYEGTAINELDSMSLEYIKKLQDEIRTPTSNGASDGATTRSQESSNSLKSQNQTLPTPFSTLSSKQIDMSNPYSNIGGGLSSSGSVRLEGRILSSSGFKSAENFFQFDDDTYGKSAMFSRSDE